LDVEKSFVLQGTGTVDLKQVLALSCNERRGLTAPRILVPYSPKNSCDLSRLEAVLPIAFNFSCRSESSKY